MAGGSPSARLRPNPAADRAARHRLPLPGADGRRADRVSRRGRAPCPSAAAATSFRRQPGGIILVVYLLVSLVAFTGRVDTNAPVYDRYLLGVGAVAILALLSATPWPAARVSRSFAAGALALALPALLSVALLQDSIAYNRAR